MTKEKILICSNHLGYGGIESSLINLINTNVFDDYDVTLLLMNKRGHLQGSIPQNIKVIDAKYRRTNGKIINKIVCKIINTIIGLHYAKKYRNCFDVSICYAPFIRTCTYIARAAAPRAIIWLHADYSNLFKDKKSLIKFEKKMYINSFDKIISVSKNGLKEYVKLFKEVKNKIIYIPNIIAGNKIINGSNEEANIKRAKNDIIFCNVSRHEEKSKKISRIIEASIKLKADGINNFKVWLIGDGCDTTLYKKLIKQGEIGDHIEILGAKDNPYPYIKNSDCMIITSDYEGDPVTFYESLVLQKNLITTEVGNIDDYRKYKNILIIKKSSESLYKTMKYICKNNIRPVTVFNYEKYNSRNIALIKKALKG